MGWVSNGPRPCTLPLFKFHRPIGSVWECPSCRREWVVQDNPDRFIGGSVLVPKEALRTGSARAALEAADHAECRPVQERPTS